MKEMPYPVHMSEEHIKRLPVLLDTWGTSASVLFLGNWNRGSRPPNVITCNILPILSIEGAPSKIPYDDSKFDACVCISILEYIREPRAFVDEMYRILKPGGIVYVEVPFLQPYNHSNPSYFRFTPDGIKYMFRNFRIDQLGMANGPGSAAYWIMRVYEALKFDRDGTYYDLISKSGSEEFIRAEGIFGVAYNHMKESDEELSRKEHAISIACSYYVIATKVEGRDDHGGES